LDGVPEIRTVEGMFFGGNGLSARDRRSLGQKIEQNYIHSKVAKATKGSLCLGSLRPLRSCCELVRLCFLAVRFPVTWLRLCRGVTLL
jgi:hypothetical protein